MLTLTVIAYRCSLKVRQGNPTLVFRACYWTKGREFKKKDVQIPFRDVSFICFSYCIIWGLWFTSSNLLFSCFLYIQWKHSPQDCQVIFQFAFSNLLFLINVNCPQCWMTIATSSYICLFTWHLISLPASLTKASSLNARHISPKDSRILRSKNTWCSCPSFIQLRQLVAAVQCYQVLSQNRLLDHSWLLISFT